ncbi:response regulator [Streptomyces klenkii]|uniref:response regulator transcription factor n=1 Tax=Streptomyces klenkii TaxID=1420899 RepID=UPI0033B0FB06
MNLLEAILAQQHTACVIRVLEGHRRIEHVSKPDEFLSWHGDGMNILVVSDGQQDDRLLRRRLEAEKYIVDWANNGATAQQLARRHLYRVILLDLALAPRESREFCSSLRRQGVEAPILVLSSSAEEHDEVEGLNAGEDDYLGKNFTYPVLLARLRVLVRLMRSAGQALTKVEILEGPGIWRMPAVVTRLSSRCM